MLFEMKTNYIYDLILNFNSYKCPIEKKNKAQEMVIITRLARSRRGDKKYI